MQLQTNNTIFHNWKVNRVIGSGSFGTVYEIEREEFGRVYKAAAKVLHIPDDANDSFLVAKEGMTEENAVYYYKSLVEDIISECDLMERMKGDSHIVSFEDHYVEEKQSGKCFTIYIRMELLTPLISFITSEDSFLSRERIIRIGIDICKGLETCQKFNIVHRDIKLENIFVSDTGKYKLGDFGVSKVMEESELAVSQKGTKLYMAPEMFRGDRYDATVDIYSLGLVLYRLANNNRAPFMPAYPQSIHIQHKEVALKKRLAGEEFPAPCNADSELANVIKKACAFVPQERYQKPIEMRLALEGLLNSACDAAPFSDSEEQASQTLLVENAEGEQALIKNKDKYTIIKRLTKMRFVVVFIFVCICICGMFVYQYNRQKEIDSKCIFNVGLLHNSTYDESVSHIVDNTLLVVEYELDKNWIYVPDVIGLEEIKAMELLVGAGYKVDQIIVSYEYSSDIVEGLVFYQSAESFTRVKKGVQISLTVSKGKKVKNSTNKSNNNNSDVQWKTID